MGFGAMKLPDHMTPEEFQKLLQEFCEKHGVEIHQGQDPSILDADLDHLMDMFDSEFKPLTDEELKEMHPADTIRYMSRLGEWVDKQPAENLFDDMSLFLHQYHLCTELNDGSFISKHKAGSCRPTKITRDYKRIDQCIMENDAIVGELWHPGYKEVAVYHFPGARMATEELQIQFEDAMKLHDIIPITSSEETYEFLLEKHEGQYVGLRNFTRFVSTVAVFDKE